MSSNASENCPTGQELDVIAVGAHPDDVEIACGGTLARLVQLGYRVGIVDLTDGEPTPLSPSPEVRLEEARKAAEILGISERIVLSLPNRRLFDDFASRVALAKIFRRHRPKVVLGFGGKTPMASPDHHQAMMITDAAVFYSRLTKWDDHFDGLPPHSVSSQLAFPIGFHTLDLQASIPQAQGCVVADISSTWEIKIEAIRAYKTQFAQKNHLFRQVEAASRVVGHAAGFEAGEVFFSYRPFGASDLISWACPGSTPPNPHNPLPNQQDPLNNLPRTRFSVLGS